MAITEVPRSLRQTQLMFDVGLRSAPDVGSVKFAGSLLIDRDLHYEDQVVVTVATEDGEVLASGTGTCGIPAFKDHEDKLTGNVSFERIHTINL